MGSHFNCTPSHCTSQVQSTSRYSSFFSFLYAYSSTCFWEILDAKEGRAIMEAQICFNHSSSMVWIGWFDIAFACLSLFFSQQLNKFCLANWVSLISSESVYFQVENLLSSCSDVSPVLQTLISKGRIKCRNNMFFEPSEETEETRVCDFARHHQSQQKRVVSCQQLLNQVSLSCDYWVVQYDQVVMFTSFCLQIFSKDNPHFLTSERWSGIDMPTSQKAFPSKEIINIFSLFEAQSQKISERLLLHDIHVAAEREKHLRNYSATSSKHKSSDFVVGVEMGCEMTGEEVADTGIDVMLVVYFDRERI